MRSPLPLITPGHASTVAAPPRYAASFGAAPRHAAPFAGGIRQIAPQNVNMAKIYQLLLAQREQNANLNSNNRNNLNAPPMADPFEGIIPLETTVQYQRFTRKIETSEEARSDLVNMLLLSFSFFFYLLRQFIS